MWLNINLISGANTKEIPRIGYLNKIKKTFLIINILLRVGKCFTHYTGTVVVTLLTWTRRGQIIRSWRKQNKAIKHTWIILSEDGNHLEVRQEYSAMRFIFSALFGVWKCAQTRVWYITPSQPSFTASRRPCDTLLLGTYQKLSKGQCHGSVKLNFCKEITSTDLNDKTMHSFFRNN